MFRPLQARLIFLLAPIFWIAAGEAHGCSLIAFPTNGGSISGGIIAAQPNDGVPSIRYSGLCGIRAPSPSSYVQENSPSSEQVFRLAFQMYTGTTSGSAVFLQGRNSGSQELFSLEYRPAESRIIARTQGASSDLGGVQSGRWYQVEVDWATPGALTTPEVAPGSMHVLVIDEAASFAAEVQVPGVDGGTASTVDSVRVGWLSGSGAVIADPKRAGIVIDNYQSRRHGPNTRPIRGDANNDQQVTAADAVMVQQELQGGPLAFGQPDCTQDGLIQPGDVTCIQALAAGARLEAGPAPGSPIALTGEAGASTIRSPIFFTNQSRGSANLDVTGCNVSGATSIAVVPSSLSVAPAQTQSLTVACTLPQSAGTIVTAQLNCATNDPANTSISYPIQCRATARPVSAGSELAVAGVADRGDRAGEAVALSEGGLGQDTVVIGSPYGGQGNAGRLIIFDGPVASKMLNSRISPGDSKATEGSSLTTTIDLSSIGGVLGNKFSGSVAISPDGETLVVGAPAQGTHGRLYVFRKPASGWQAIGAPEIVDAPPAAFGVSPSDFGDEVAFASESTLIVGAPASNVDGRIGAGSAFVLKDFGGFSYSGGALVASEPVGGAGFASSIAASADRYVLGAPNEPEGGVPDAGAAYVFPVVSGTTGEPQRIARSSPGIGDKFGTRVAHGNEVVAVGSPGDDTSAGANSGSATVFKPSFPGSGLIEGPTLIPAAGADQGAGSSLAVTGTQLLVGAPLANVDRQLARGRIYAYDLDANLTTIDPSVVDSSFEFPNQGFGEVLVAGARVILTGVPGADPSIEELDRGRLDVFVVDRIFRGTFE